MSFTKYIETHKGKAAFFMLPLLVLLLFSCPVKRALSPSFSDSALSIQNGNHFNKKVGSFAFVNTSPCPQADKIIRKPIVVQQRENPSFLSSFSLPAANLFVTQFIIVKETRFINNTYYIPFSAPLFLKNRSLLI